jgi:hypothetical protein
MFCDWCFTRIGAETQIVALTMMNIPVVFCKKCYWDRKKAEARREIEKIEDLELEEVY